MKNLKLITLALTMAFSGCKSIKYTQLGDGLFADIQTNKGAIVVKLYYEQTPVTVASFVSLAEGKSPFVSDSLKGKRYYDGVIFHRVIKDFMIQGGDPTGTGSGSPGYKFEDEIVDSLTHNKPGMLSMANSGPNTNGSQFFITHKPVPRLNGGYTVFGEVVKGIEVVDSIANVKTAKEPKTKDRPLEDVIMNKVEIIRNGKSAKKFDAVKVMKTYFEEINKREEKVKKIAEALAAEFKTQKMQAQVLPTGLSVFYLYKSNGIKPKTGQTVMVNYAGFLADGTLFDTSWLAIAENYQKVDKTRKQRNEYTPFPMLYSPEARLIPGFKEGLQLMNVGDKVRLFIPSFLGYGPAGKGGVIPPDADLIFDVEIVEIAEK
jgi:peptidyl-prolyl cis-trans isomerase A (cyclophilin A)